MSCPIRITPPCLRKLSLKIVAQISSKYQEPHGDYKFITQTLKPSNYKLPAYKQFQYSIGQLSSILNEMCEDFCIVAELTEKGNVHYHFWCIFQKHYSYREYQDVVKCGLTFGLSYLTVIKHSKTVEDHKKSVREYMLKDIKETYKYLRSQYIISVYDPTVSQFIRELEENDGRMSLGITESYIDEM